MSVFARVVDRLRAPRKLDPDVAARLGAWQALREPDLARAHAEIRYVVVDTETTGLDLRHDRLIAIGAASVRGLALPLADGFDVILRQDEASADANILIHGIGGQAQLGGAAPATALVDFLAFAGKAPLVAFRAEFDASVIERAARAHLGLSLARRWIDLAFLLPALFPGNEARTLEDWLAIFSIPAGERHYAVADAYACGELLLLALTEAARKGMATPADLLSMQKAQQWLGRR